MSAIGPDEVCSEWALLSLMQCRHLPLDRDLSAKDGLKFSVRVRGGGDMRKGIGRLSGGVTLLVLLTSAPAAADDPGDCKKRGTSAL
jgi:hypothetical protein